MLTSNFKNELKYYNFFNEKGEWESGAYMLFLRINAPTDTKIKTEYSEVDDPALIYQIALEILDSTLPIELRGDAHNQNIFSKRWFKKQLAICHWIHDGPLENRLKRFYKRIYGITID